jgi:hypothetical protein
MDNFGEATRHRNIYDKIDERFKYGELRLSRLNKIYRFTRFPLLLDPYVTRWHQYGGLLRDNFTWLASMMVYIVVVLAAMQVGLGIEKLKYNGSFVAASYGFTIFSMLGPLIGAGLIMVAFSVLFIINWRDTLEFWGKRSSDVQLRQPAPKKPNKAGNSTFV